MLISFILDAMILRAQLERLYWNDIVCCKTSSVTKTQLGDRLSKLKCKRNKMEKIDEIRMFMKSYYYIMCGQLEVMGVWNLDFNQCSHPRVYYWKPIEIKCLSPPFDGPWNWLNVFAPYITFFKLRLPKNDILWNFLVLQAAQFILMTWMWTTGRMLPIC